MRKSKNLIVATFSDADTLVRTVRMLRAEKFRIYDVFAPFPIHDLDQAMGVRKTRLPWITVLAGLTGLSFAVFLQFYTTVLDWPMNVGGKPDNFTLAFVPISFELTVLTAGLASVAAFFVRARLFPGQRERLITERVTNDTFALVLRKRDTQFDGLRAREILVESGADVVEEKAANL